MNATVDRFTSEEKNILIFTCAAHFLSHMLILVFPAVTMPLSEELGRPIEEILEISFFMYLVYGLSALPVGYVVDRWEARTMMLLGLLGMGAGLILAGYARSSSTIASSLVLVGLGASIYHPAGLSLISKTVRRRGRALAINGISGILGVAAAPLFTGILTWIFSWRWAFIVLGLVSVMAALIMSLVRINETLERDVGDTRKDSDGRYKLYFLILCFTLVFVGLCYRGNMLLLPAYLELKTTFFLKLIESFSFIKLHGTATLAATVLSSIILLTGVFGQMLGGRLADRYDLRRAYLFIHAASVPFLFLMAFTSNALLAASAAMYVFFNLGMQPIENSLIAAVTPSQWRSTSYAVKFILNFGVGATVIYLIGPIKRSYSIETVYVFLGGLSILLVGSIVVLLIVSRRIPEIKN